MGDCPSSQRIMMILKLKGLHFTPECVDLNKKDTKKWEEFVRRSQGRLKLPVLIHGDREPMEDADCLEEYLEKTFQEPSLSVSSDSKAKAAGRDLYSKFALFMRNSNPSNDAKLRSALNKELEKLNEFLNESPGGFLDGDQLKLPDCNLLPKLMHVKEAGELKGFSIPQDYEAVLTYLKEATKQRAFRDTFPDPVKKEIKAGWKTKMGNSMH